MAERQSGLIAVLAGITMLFAAFTSAYVVRRGIGSDWTRLSLPPMAYAILLPMAGTTSILAAARHRDSVRVMIPATGAALGGLAGILLMLSRPGATEAGPAMAFFRVISGTFLVFLLGGVAALVYLAYRRTRHPISAYFLYWLYLCGLWTYLLLFLWFWS